MGIISKEILPIDIRYMTTDISQLPADVLSKIVSYKLGDPKYMRLNYNKKFRQIQNKFKITYKDKYISLSGDAEIYRWDYTIKGKYISHLSIENQWLRIINFYERFVDEQTDDDDDVSLDITSKMHFTVTKQDNSKWTGLCAVYMKLLNANRSYIESEIEKMAEIAKNKLERTRLEFMQDECKTFKLDYITIQILVRTEDDYILPVD